MGTLKFITAIRILTVPQLNILGLCTIVRGPIGQTIMTCRVLLSLCKREVYMSLNSRPIRSTPGWYSGKDSGQ